MTRMEKTEYGFLQLFLIAAALLFYHGAMNRSLATGHLEHVDMAGLVACALVGLVFGIAGLAYDYDPLALAGGNIFASAGGCLITKLAAMAWDNWWAVSLPSILVMVPSAAVLALIFFVCWSFLAGSRDTFQNIAFATIWVAIPNIAIIGNYLAY